MDFFSPTERMSFVLCPFCSVYLAVEVPSKLMEVVQVNCGHCNKISFYSPIAPMYQSMFSPEYQMSSQSSCFTDYRRSQPLTPAASSLSYEPASPKPPYVVKPPEKKHRLPSAYNRFMREEIKRIKAAKPDIPHREAFSMAAKNWAKSDPRSSPTVSSASDITTVCQRPISVPIERGNVQKITERFDVFKQFDRKI